MRIGVFQTAGLEAFWDGGIDELSIDGRALSCNEIATAWQGGAVGFSNIAGDASPADGRAGRWQGEGNSNDSAGTNNGTLGGGATATAAGVIGQAFSFNGATNAIVDLPSTANGNLDITGNQFTIQTWVYQTDGTQTNGVANGSQMIFWKHNGAAAGYQLATFSNGIPEIEIATTNSGNAFVVGSAALPLNTWIHLAATYDGANIRLYQNGVPIGSTPATGNIVHSNWDASIGNAATVHDYAFKGRIDELNIYNRALSAGEIAATYNAVSVGNSSLFADATTSIANRISQWRGDGSAADSIASNAGTLVNGATYAAGPIGQAFSLEGVDDYVNVSSSAQLESGT